MIAGGACVNFPEQRVLERNRNQENGEFPA